MIAGKKFRATCKGCGIRFDLFEYKGLSGGLYGSHSCLDVKDREKLYGLPGHVQMFKNLKQVKL